MKATQDYADVKAVKRIRTILASTVKMERVSYLWESRIPRGKQTMLDGRMGSGKTTILCDVIAAVTTGRPLPGQTSTPVGDCLLISLEDDKSDTLVPRLTAAGADVNRCHLFDGYTVGTETHDGVFDLALDVERLRFAIEDTYPRIVLVAIDPFMAALGESVDSYKDQAVRRVLAPLSQLAEETGVAIIFSRHFRKSGGVAEDAGGGSGGIGNACRSVLRVDVDPENDERYLLSSVKASTSKKPATLGYRIVGVQLPGEYGEHIDTSKIEWDGESTWTAQALASHAMNADERPRAVEAQDWLRDALGRDPITAKELKRNAETDGVAWRTVQRAGDVLGVIKTRIGFGAGSNWSLPPTAPPFTPPISTARMDNSGANGVADDPDAALFSPDVLAHLRGRR